MITAYDVAEKDRTIETTNDRIRGPWEIGTCYYAELHAFLQREEDEANGVNDESQFYGEDDGEYGEGYSPTETASKDSPGDGDEA